VSAKNPDDPHSRQINTGGGSYVEGDVHTGGDFVGRDKIVVEVHPYSPKKELAREEELDNYLKEAIPTYINWMHQLNICSSKDSPDQPYKFVYAFGIEDAGIFFGRKAAKEALYQTVCKNRLTVLHARSGAGKTSLLNAGLLPRLISEGLLPVYARAYKDPKDPFHAIKRAIASRSLCEQPPELYELPLDDFLRLSCNYLTRSPMQELVIILDQFEEFFIHWPGRDDRQPFIDVLASCYDSTLPLRFIIALRTDYYSDLVNLQGSIPKIFHNEYRLDAMTRGEAESAITGPVAKLDQPVTYERALLDTLLDDLDPGGMELPHLQIMCTRLYDDVLAKGEATLTPTCYEELGRAEGMLGDYLNDVLNRLPGRRGTIAREILKKLACSEATKRVLEHDTLAARVEAEEDELTDVLDRLVNDRLLRRGRDEVKGKIVYEMPYDYLAKIIKGWLDQEKLEVKRAKGLLESQLGHFRASGALMSADHLDRIAAQSGRLKPSDEEQDLLLRSALACNHNVAYWWTQYYQHVKNAPHDRTGEDKPIEDSMMSVLLGDDRQHAWRLANTLWPEGKISGGLPQNEALGGLVKAVRDRLESKDVQQKQRAREIQVFIDPLAQQPLSGHIQLLQTGFRLLIKDRWPAILTLALGGALGGLAGGLIQTFVGLKTGFVGHSPGSLTLLEFVIINEPAMATFGLLIGAGLGVGAVLARGRRLLLEVSGAAVGGAMGGFLITFYFLILGIMSSGPIGLVAGFIAQILVCAVFAASLIGGMRVANKWCAQGHKNLKRLIRYISGAVLAASMMGLVMDIVFDGFPAMTLLGACLGACYATGLGVAEQRLP
jgi:hypothetical protein